MPAQMVAIGGAPRPPPFLHMPASLEKDIEWIGHQDSGPVAPRTRKNRARRRPAPSSPIGHRKLPSSPSSRSTDARVTTLSAESPQPETSPTTATRTPRSTPSTRKTSPSSRRRRRVRSFVDSDKRPTTADSERSSTSIPSVRSFSQQSRSCSFSDPDSGRRLPKTPSARANVLGDPRTPAPARPKGEVAIEKWVESAGLAHVQGERSDT